MRFIRAQRHQIASEMHGLRGFVRRWPYTTIFVVLVVVLEAVLALWR